MKFMCYYWNKITILKSFLVQFSKKTGENPSHSGNCLRHPVYMLPSGLTSGVAGHGESPFCRAFLLPKPVQYSTLTPRHIPGCWIISFPNSIVSAIWVVKLIPYLLVFGSNLTGMMTLLSTSSQSVRPCLNKFFCSSFISNGSLACNL